MPDDLVLNVRQIAQYPFRAAALATDAILLQTGGLGGPYAYTDPKGLLAPLASGGPLGIGTSPPYDAFGAQTFTGWSVLEAEGSLVFNAYADRSGVARYLVSGHPAGILSMDASQGFSFGWAVPGTADVPVEWNTIFNIHPDGSQWVSSSVAITGELSVGAGASVAGDLNVGGHATVLGDEVATWRRVQDFVVDFAFTHNVRSWNGQRGDVCFGIRDLIAMGGAPRANPRFDGRATLNGDPLATENYVLSAISGIFTLNHLICLGLAPLHSPPFAGQPTAPTPPLTNSSDRLATTRFVHQFASTRIDTAVNDAVDLATAGLDSTISEMVDEAIRGVISQGAYLPLHGGTLTGPLVMGANANITTVDGETLNIDSRGNISVEPRQDHTLLLATTGVGSVVVQAYQTGNVYLDAKGGVMEVSKPPTTPMGIANKGYVDGAVGAGGNFLPLHGGLLTGPLSFTDLTIPDVVGWFRTLSVGNTWRFERNLASTPIANQQNWQSGFSLDRLTGRLSVDHPGGAPSGQDYPLLRVRYGTEDLFSVGVEWGDPVTRIGGYLWMDAEEGSTGLSGGYLGLEAWSAGVPLISLERQRPPSGTPGAAIAVWNSSTADSFVADSFSDPSTYGGPIETRITHKGEFIGTRAYLHSSAAGGPFLDINNLDYTVDSLLVRNGASNRLRIAPNGAITFFNDQWVVYNDGTMSMSTAFRNNMRTALGIV